MNATDFLANKQVVDEAVTRLEQRSAAEVVCVVATESGRYDRAESLVGLALGLIGLALADASWTAMAGGWGSAAPLLWQAGFVSGFFAVGVALASFVHPVRRLFVPAREMEEEVRRGALAAFAGSRVHDTARRTGVLVYVSLFEQRVVVLLDSGVRAAIGDDLAKQLVDAAIVGLKAGKRAEVLAALIDQVGDALAVKLPADPQNPDELPNHVIALHPR
jgi:putative membrane protein